MKIYTIIIDKAIWTAKSFALNSKYFVQTPTCVKIKSYKMRLLLLKAVLRDVPGLYFLNVLKRLLAVCFNIAETRQIFC